MFFVLSCSVFFPFFFFFWLDVCFVLLLGGSARDYTSMGRGRKKSEREKEEEEEEEERVHGVANHGTNDGRNPQSPS